MFEDKKTSDVKLPDLTPDQLQAVLQKFMGPMLEGMIKAQSAMNPMEQEKYDEEVQRKKRRAMLMVEFGNAEAQRIQNRKHGCTHSRAPQGAKNAGNAVARGQGEWCTGGQLTGRETATLVCCRCGYFWQFKPTLAELDQIENQGLMGWSPPPPERIIAEG